MDWFLYDMDLRHERVKSVVKLVCENSDHSRIAALSCTDIVIQEVERQISLLKAILWSGSCASQSPSSLVFHLLANEWR